MALFFYANYLLLNKYAIVIMNEQEKYRYIISESDWTKQDIEKAVDAALKSNRDVSKTLEKKVKELVANSVNTLFRTLWQRRNFYEDEIKR